MKIEIDWYTQPDEIPKPYWEAFYENYQEGLEGWDLLAHSNLDDQFIFYFGLVKNEDVPIGILPAFVFNVPLDVNTSPLISRFLRSPIGSFLRYQKTLFLGSPLDEGNLSIGIKLSQQNVAPLQQAIAKQAHKLGVKMIIWKDFWGAEQTALDTVLRDHVLFRVPSYPGTYQNIESSFEKYLENLPGGHRISLRRNLKKGKHFIDFAVSTERFPSNDTIKELFSLYLQTFEKGKIKFEKLTLQYFEQAAQAPNIYFILLRNRSNNKLAAFSLCVLQGSLACTKFIGVDYTIGKDARIVFQLWEAIYRWAVQVGAQVISSTQTAYQHKLEQGFKLVPYYHYCQHLNPFLNRFFAWVTKGMVWMDLDEDLKEYIKKHPKVLENLISSPEQLV